MPKKAKKSEEKLKNFKVRAEIVTYAYIVVRAKNAEEANDKADELAQEDVPFITEENGGEFNILRTLTTVTKEKVS